MLSWLFEVYYFQIFSCPTVGRMIRLCRRAILGQIFSKKANWVLESTNAEFDAELKNDLFNADQLEDTGI